MPTYDSVQYALRGSVTSKATPLEVNVSGGAVRVAYALWLDDASQLLVENDIINLFVLPKGAKPLAYSVIFGAHGAGVTLDLGWDGDADALETGLDISSAGVVALDVVDDATPVTADKVVQASFKDANPDESIQLEVTLWYVQQ